MNHNSLAEKYLNAFRGAIKGESKISSLETLRGVVHSILSNENLKDLATSPLYTSEQKYELLKSTVLDKCKDVTVVNFIKVLNHKGRLSLIQDISNQLDSVILEEQNITECRIYTSEEIGDSTVNQITNSLNYASNKTLQPQLTVDPNMLGGFKAFIGYRVYDASIKSSLERLKETLTKQRS